MSNYERHPDREVEAALVRLADTLCAWERSTGRSSVMILRERDWSRRLVDGKPVGEGCDDVDDASLLMMPQRPR